MSSHASPSNSSNPTGASARLIFISGFAEGDAGAIQAFHFDPATGSLTPATRTPIDTPFFLAMSADRKYLYSIDHFSEGRVAAFAIEGEDGQLRRLNDQSAGGKGACYLDIDATGRSVIVANYSGGTVATLAVRDDGSLDPSQQVVAQSGSSVNADRQEAPHAHCFKISPNNRFAYVPDLGLDQILCFELDAAAAKLSSLPQPFVRTIPGAGPRHFTFHPSQPRAYVINELLNSVTLFDWSAEAGTLFEQDSWPTLPDDFAGVSHTADLKVTPDGRFLYGTNRGHDSIACFAIDGDGRLSRQQIEPSRGGGPQNLAITDDGRWLICANMAGGSVTVFRIESDGQLTAVGEPIELPGASCVMLV